EPDPHRLVAFHHGIAADPAALVRMALVRDADVASLAIPLPPVEGADQILALHPAAVSEVGAEMFTVGVEYRDPTGCRSPGHHLAAEVLHLVHRTGGDLTAPGHLEPARRLHRQRRFRHL